MSTPIVDTAVPLGTIRDFVEGLTWVENGLMSGDVIHVIDFLTTTPDSRYFVHQTRRCLVVMRHWQERVRYTIRKLEFQVAASRDRLDPIVRQNLVSPTLIQGQARPKARQVRTRFVEAGIMADCQHASLVDSIHQYELVLGTLEGIDAALDTSLVVQEAVSTRRNEVEDSLTQS